MKKVLRGAWCVVLLASMGQAAVVNVRDFGALPNDGKEDTAAFEAARSAAGAGGTVIVPIGSFDIRQMNPGDRITWLGSTAFHCSNPDSPPGVAKIYVLDQSSAIKAIGSHAFWVRGSGVTIKGMTFEGRAIWIENSTIAVDQLNLDGCWFNLNVTSGDHKSAVQFQTWLTNSRITNCVFGAIQSEVGIYGYKWAGLTIANNAFLNGVEGIHLIGKGDVKDLLVQQNYFAGLSRMGVELQESGWNNVVEDNWYESPRSYGADTMAYSVIADQAQSPRTRRNVHVSPVSAATPDRIGVRIIFEGGGIDAVIERNYSVGGNHVIAANGSRGTGVARFNRILNFREGPRTANGNTMTFHNNGADVDIGFDPVERGKPGPFRRYGEDPPPIPPTTQPTPPPTTQFVDDRIVEIRAIQQSGKVTVTRP